MYVEDRTSFAIDEQRHFDRFKRVIRSVREVLTGLDALTTSCIDLLYFDNIK
jgi:hypothetical protein